MPYPLHSVKVETQVVDGIEDLRQDLVGRIKVPQIGTGIPPADAAPAVGVERTLILGIAGLFDRDFAP